MSDTNSLANSSSDSPTSHPKTRRSTRDIKRKKFDDEIIGNGGRSVSVAKRARLSSTESASSTTSSTALMQPSTSSPIPAIPPAVGSKPAVDLSCVAPAADATPLHSEGLSADMKETELHEKGPELVAEPLEPSKPNSASSDFIKEAALSNSPTSASDTKRTSTPVEPSDQRNVALPADNGQNIQASTAESGSNGLSFVDSSINYQTPLSDPHLTNLQPQTIQNSVSLSGIRALANEAWTDIPVVGVHEGKGTFSAAQHWATAGQSVGHAEHASSHDIHPHEMKDNVGMPATNIHDTSGLGTMVASHNQAQTPNQKASNFCFPTMSQSSDVLVNPFLLGSFSNIPQQVPMEASAMNSQELRGTINQQFMPVPSHATGLVPGFLPALPPAPIVNPGTTAYAVVADGKKEFGDRNKRKSKSRKATNSQTADLQAKNSVGRWLPTDDLALITAILQTNDLKAVQRGVKFSCKFSPEEISQRWYCLLYDKSISKNSVDAMKSMNPEIVLAVQSKTLYSAAEEDLLRQLPASSHPPLNLATFERILMEHPHVFHPARSPQSLLQHWQMMSQYSLLADQKVTPLLKRDADYKLSLSDLEDSLLGHDSTNPVTPSSAPGGGGSDLRIPPAGALGSGALEIMASVERNRATRIARNEMRVLENEIPRYQTLVESVTGISPPDFDSQTLAVLRGRVVRYLMRSREITFGRSSKAHVVDIDLSLEGPSCKVSRRHGTIKMKPTGDFVLANDGNRPVFIDGRPVLTGCSGRLEHNSVVEISCLRLIFLIHQDLISTLRSEAVKLMIVN